VYNWNGIKLFMHPLDINFVPGTMIEVHSKLIVCDGKGKFLEIPFNEDEPIKEV